MEIQDQSDIRKLIEFEGMDEYEEEMKRAHNARLSLIDLGLMEKAFFSNTYQRWADSEDTYFIGYADKTLEFEDGTEGEFGFVVAIRKSTGNELLQTQPKTDRMRLPENPLLIEDHNQYLKAFADFVPVEPKEVPDYLAKQFVDFDAENWNDFLD